MNLTLILILGGLAILITLLMRPDIYLSVLRGGGEKVQRKVYRAKSDEDFQAGLEQGRSLTEEKRDNHHG